MSETMSIWSSIEIAEKSSDAAIQNSKLYSREIEYNEGRNDVDNGDQDRYALEDLAGNNCRYTEADWSGQAATAGIYMPRYTTTCSTHMVCKVLDKLNGKQIVAIEGMGFASLLELKDFDINLELLSWLVENFDPIESALNVHGIKLNVCQRDVEFVLGLKNEGIELVDGEFVIDENIEKELNIKAARGHIRLSDIERDLNSMESWGIEFKVKFALLMIGGLLRPGIDGGVNRSLIPILARLDDLGKINWAKYVMDGIAKELHDMPTVCGSRVGGCMVFLMIHYLEHVHLKGGTFVPICFRATPRIRAWDQTEFILRVSKLRAAGTFRGVEVDVVVEDERSDSNARAADYYLKEQKLVACILRELKDDIMQLRSRQESLEAIMRSTEAAVLANHNRIRSAAVNRHEDVKSRKHFHMGNRMISVADEEVETSPSKNLNSKVEFSRNTFKPTTPAKGINMHQVRDNGVNDVDDGITSPMKGKKTTSTRQSKASNRGRNVEKCALSCSVEPKIGGTISTFCVVVPSNESESEIPKQKHRVMAMGCKSNKRSYPNECGAMAGRRQVKYQWQNQGDTARRSDEGTRNSEPYSKLRGKEEHMVGIRTKAKWKVHEYIMNPKLPLTTIIVHIMSHMASRDAMQSLLPRQRICSEVISCYVAMLTREARKASMNTSYRYWYLPVEFAVQSLNPNQTAEELYSAFLTNEDYGGPIYECEKICVPLNWMGIHWYMCVINLVKKSITVLDSRPVDMEIEARQEMAITVCERIQEALWLGCSTKHTNNLEDFQCDTPEWCPLQSNEFDCGVYILKFMEMCDCLTQDRTLELDSEVERASIAIRLFLYEGNLVKERGLKMLRTMGIDV